MEKKRNGSLLPIIKKIKEEGFSDDEIVRVAVYIY